MSQVEVGGAGGYSEAVREHLARVERMGALVLAAGASSRMGSPKALLDWGGESLLAHQLRLLGELPFADVLVMLGHDEPEISGTTSELHDAHVAYNARHIAGRSSSIRFGAQILREIGSILIVNVDQPLSRGLLGDLLGGAVENREAPILVPAFEGRRGHPVLIRRPIFDELALIEEETEGLKGIMHRAPDRRLPILTLNDHSVLSLNTFSLYATAIQRYFGSQSSDPT
ncbi:MAG TPA: nucleotidyltransferase family protein [Chloroflexota bacterium]|nr:nucleotidyltransferase family protein [Chloroflexota bacterium]